MSEVIRYRSLAGTNYVCLSWYQMDEFYRMLVDDAFAPVETLTDEQKKFLLYNSDRYKQHKESVVIKCRAEFLNIVKTFRTDFYKSNTELFDPKKDFPVEYISRLLNSEKDAVHDGWFRLQSFKGDRQFGQYSFVIFPDLNSQPI